MSNGSGRVTNKQLSEQVLALTAIVSDMNREVGETRVRVEAMHDVIQRDRQDVLEMKESCRKRGEKLRTEITENHEEAMKEIKKVEIKQARISGIFAGLGMIIGGFIDKISSVLSW